MDYTGKMVSLTFCGNQEVTGLVKGQSPTYLEMVDCVSRMDVQSITNIRIIEGTPNRLLIPKRELQRGDYIRTGYFSGYSKLVNAMTYQGTVILTYEDAPEGKWTDDPLLKFDVVRLS